jgi:hypothetical protein
MRSGTVASPNLSCFQIVEIRARVCSISMRSFYDSHLLNLWALNRCMAARKQPDFTGKGLLLTHRHPHARTMPAAVENMIFCRSQKSGLLRAWNFVR